MNHKRIYRLYVEEKLSLRRKRGRKRSRVRQPLPEAVAANQVELDRVPFERGAYRLSVGDAEPPVEAGQFSR